MNKLNLYYEDQLIGFLSEDSNHLLEFEYASSWISQPEKFAISFSMPLKPGIYKQQAQNFFSNLLPEGDIRSSVAQKIGVSVDNDFRLLEALGGECAGALTIGHDPLSLESRYLPLNIQTIKDNYQSGTSVLATLQNEEEDVRLSLAGAQDKLPVFFKDQSILLPQGNSPSSHILKPPSRRFKHLPENECIMGLYAKYMGLSVPHSQLLQVGDFRVFLIDRYDRKYRKDQLVRIHQEDFCQALSYSYKAKYEKDGGPKFSKCYEAVENHSTLLPEDLEKMVRWLIFNVIIGNCDAHAKNVSFLMTSPQQWQLAPHYDLVCTKAYTGISKDLAMNIGGSYDSGTVTGTHWKKLAQEVQFGEKLIIQLVQEMSEVAIDRYDQVQKDFSEIYGQSPILYDIRKVIHEQQRRLLSEIKK